MKYEGPFVNFFSEKSIFTTGDARRFLSVLGASEVYTRLLLHNMIRTGRLYRIGKGTYTFNKNEAVVGFEFRPFYYGMQYALTIRKLWTQQSTPVIITRRMANPGVRSALGIKVIVHRINENAFFGFDYVKYGGIFVPVSDPEKTLLDFKYYGIRIDPDTMKVLERISDRKKLEEYSKMLSGNGVDKVSLPSTEG
jgi:predicted transcriptional regulator of viral defense system